MRRVVGLRNLVILSIALSMARASAADTSPVFALDQQCFSLEELRVKANPLFDLISTPHHPARLGQATLGTWGA